MLSEPKRVRLMWEHKRDDILGHEVVVSEWSDGVYTVFVADKYTTLMDNDITWDYFPSDKEIQLCVEERMEEGA